MAQKGGAPFLLSLFMFLSMLSSLCDCHPHPVQSMSSMAAVRAVSNHTTKKGKPKPCTIRYTLSNRHIQYVWKLWCIDFIFNSDKHMDYGCELSLRCWKNCDSPSIMGHIIKHTYQSIYCELILNMESVNMLCLITAEQFFMSF